MTTNLTNSYTKTNVRDNHYYEIQVVETIRCELPINPAIGVFKVTHIGANNQIRIISEYGVEYTCTNPFKKLAGGSIHDIRDNKCVDKIYSIAVPLYDNFKTHVVETIGMDFDLSPEIMASLFNDIYIRRNPTQEYYVELTKELLDTALVTQH